MLDKSYPEGKSIKRGYVLSPKCSGATALKVYREGYPLGEEKVVSVRENRSWLLLYVPVLSMCRFVHGACRKNLQVFRHGTEVHRHEVQPYGNQPTVHPQVRPKT